MYFLATSGFFTADQEKQITDTERLDFIEKNDLNISHWHEKNSYGVHDIYNEYSANSFNSIREAIDDAMRGSDGD